MGKRGYAPEFRRRVLELIGAGRRVSDRGPCDQRAEDLHVAPPGSDRLGLEAGLSLAEHAELIAARRRIRELETELTVHRRATELLRGNTDPKGDSRRSKWWPRTACRRSLRVGCWASPCPATTRGANAHPRRAHSATCGSLGSSSRSTPIAAACTAPGEYMPGSRWGHRIPVGCQAVEMLMRRAGLQGVSGRPLYRRAPNLPTVGDLVDRQFPRTAPDRL